MRKGYINYRISKPKPVRVYAKQELNVKYSTPDYEPAKKKAELPSPVERFLKLESLDKKL